MAELFECAANRIEALMAARGRLLEEIERSQRSKRRGQRTSRGVGQR
jgi:hypothetical protein